MKKLIALACVATALTGCFSVVRIGKLDSGGYKVWSEEKMDYVWQEYTGGHTDPMAQFGLFPTMKMRWELLRLSWHWAPPKSKWSQHLGIPCGILALTPGIIVDLPVDIISIPWDWKYRNNKSKTGWIEKLDEERAYRSVCVNCGKTSDGEFARCKKRENDRTADWKKYYGVCPDCVSTVKTNGYYFEEW